jgi:flagellar motility protein MotE (MotC chaperone)
LEEDRKQLEDEKQGRVDEKLKKAQAEMLKSFSAMEPEDVVNAFTGGKTVQELVNQGNINAVVDKAVSYLSQMSARQRAGVLQAMEPELTTVVVQKLETSYPL